MHKIIVIFLTIFLFSSILSAQDNEQLLKLYYETIGSSISKLIDSWGEPIKKENTHSGMVYYFKKNEISFKFSTHDKTVVLASMKLQPETDDASILTFYVIWGFKLQKDGFIKIDSTYDARDISVNGTNHNFLRKYEISDKFKRDSLLINLQLERGLNYKLYLESHAYFESNHIAENLFSILNREEDYFKRISQDINHYLFGENNFQEFYGFDNSDIVTYKVENFSEIMHFYLLIIKYLKLIMLFKGKTMRKLKNYIIAMHYLLRILVLNIKNYQPMDF